VLWKRDPTIIHIGKATSFNTAFLSRELHAKASMQLAGDRDLSRPNLKSKEG
jgi:hypothetical protein